MANSIAKNTNIVFIAAMPGTLGTQGTPAIPAYISYETVTTQATVGLYHSSTGALSVTEQVPGGLQAGQPTNPVPVNVPILPNGASGVLVAGGSKGGIAMVPVTKKVSVYHPAVPAVPGIPAIPATPAQVVRMYNLGWNSWASSAQLYTGSFDYSFQVTLNNVGIVTGISAPFDAAAEPYSAITYGFYVALRGVFIIENGVIKTGAFPLANMDRLHINRTNGVMTYLDGSTLLYTSAATSNEYSMGVNAYFYSGGDSLINVECYPAPALLSGNLKASRSVLAGTDSTKAVLAGNLIARRSKLSGYDSGAALSGNLKANRSVLIGTDSVLAVLAGNLKANRSTLKGTDAVTLGPPAFGYGSLIASRSQLSGGPIGTYAVLSGNLKPRRSVLIGTDSVHAVLAGNLIAHRSTLFGADWTILPPCPWSDPLAGGDAGISLSMDNGWGMSDWIGGGAAIGLMFDNKSAPAWIGGGPPIGISMNPDMVRPDNLSQDWQGGGAGINISMPTDWVGMF